MSELKGIRISADARPFMRDMRRVRWLMELYLGSPSWYRRLYLRFRLWLQERTT